MKLDGCFRHVIILIQVCKPGNCTWKELIGQIFISFYLYRHSGEIRRSHREFLPSAFSTCTHTKQLYGSVSRHGSPYRTVFAVTRPYSFLCPRPCQLADRPPPFPLPPGSAALLHSPSTPGLPSDFFCRRSCCAAPHSGTFKTWAQRQREERERRMCLSGFVKRIFKFFL